jgi:ProP effector
MHPTTESPPVDTPPDAEPSEAPQAGATAVADGADAAAVSAPASAVPAQEPVGAAAPIPDLAPAACAAKLAELFPAVFTPGQPQPLKLRIQADIQELAPGTFTRKALSAFLHRHTTSTAYLRALLAAPNRIDLSGQPAGEVATEHRAAATLELQRRRDLFEARRVAERQAQREAQRLAQQAVQGHLQQVQAEPGDALAAPGAAADSRAPHTAPTDTRRPRPPHRDARRGQPTRGDSPRTHAPQGDARRGPSARNEPRRDRATTAPDGRRPQPRPNDTQRAQMPPAPDVRSAQAAHQPAVAPAIAPAQPPQDPQRRDRQALLRAFESTTLTKRNFCALKGLSQAELDAQLALARQDAGSAQPAQEKSPQSQPRRAGAPAPSANRS